MSNDKDIPMKLELVPVPVSDIDRSKEFYTEKLGFNVDLDVQPAQGMRIVQLTPPGSACSIVLGTGLPLIAMEPGILRGLHLVVSDIEDVREAMIKKGVKVDEVTEQGGIKYAPFSDPDGNTWTFQELNY